MRRFLVLLLVLPFPLLGLTQAECRFVPYRDEIFRDFPDAAARAQAIEAFTAGHIASLSTQANGIDLSASPSGPISIPVVVHVIYHNALENISDAQIQGQIDVLNNDYNRQNADTSKTPTIFQPVAANCGFRFVLAKVDPYGYATIGIIRKYSPILVFGLDDAVKYSNKGGDDAWDPNSYLNIWVSNLTDGVLGYSSVVGGPKDRDGVVVLYTAFGRNGTATAPFNLGRTATHEIGHWLNLIHTWGDADCGNDHVADTPPQQTADRGCPQGVLISCNNAPTGDMYTNFMDFTNDDCMNLFTNGQHDRMSALFAPGGPRNPLLTSTALTAIPKAGPDPDLGGDEGGKALRVFPNPASAQLGVLVPDSLWPGSTVNVFDGQGRLLMSEIMSQGQQFLNVSKLPQGLYYISLVSGKGRRIAKWIKSP